MNATKTCLRYVDTPTHYPNATLDCKKDDADLVKLDTKSLKNIFLDFIDGRSSIPSKIIIDFKIIVHLKVQMTKYTAVNILSSINISMKIESFLLIYHSNYVSTLFKTNCQMENIWLKGITPLNLIEKLVVDNTGLIKPKSQNRLKLEKKYLLF